MSLLLGAIADDFTGATDLASTLVGEGMRATQVIGVPDASTEIGDADAVVIALKSRTAPVDEAVSQSLAALQWLCQRGARQIFFKYCSTFDSTPRGNIGPVSDALMDALDTDFAFICPAFPTNGRRILGGELYVGDSLLCESPMKDHPLTPMRDANLLRLMDAQSSKRCGLIALDDVRDGSACIESRVSELRVDGFSYAVTDAQTDADLIAIGRAGAEHSLLTGASGLGFGLAHVLCELGLTGPAVDPPPPSVAGRCLVLAGSCSAATREQIEQVRSDWPCRKIDVDAIADGEDVAQRLIEWAKGQDPARPVLVYASADPAEVADIQARHGAGRAGSLVEGVMGKVARGLLDEGFGRIVVAGGETSGAVVSALGVGALRIGPQIDPGVPWTETLGRQRFALALKSGNFGSRDFLRKAFGMLT